MAQTCRDCDADLATDARWCGQCGEPAPRDADEGAPTRTSPALVTVAGRSPAREDVASSSPTTATSASAAGTEQGSVPPSRTEAHRRTDGPPPEARVDDDAARAARPLGGVRRELRERHRLLVAAVVVVALVAALAIAGRASDEPVTRTATMAGGDARRDGVVATVDPPTPTDVAWTAAIDDPEGLTVEVEPWAVAGDGSWTALRQPAGTITVLDAGTGEVLGSRWLRGTLRRAGDLVLQVDDTDGRLRGWRLPELTLAWDREVPTALARGGPLVVARDEPVVLASFSWVARLDPADGALVWERTYARTDEQPTTVFAVDAPPDEPTLLVVPPDPADQDRRVQVVDASDGRVLLRTGATLLPDRVALVDGRLHLADAAVDVGTAPDGDGPASGAARDGGAGEVVVHAASGSGEWPRVGTLDLPEDARPTALFRLDREVAITVWTGDESALLGFDGPGEPVWRRRLDGSSVEPVPGGLAVVVAGTGGVPTVAAVLSDGGRDVLPPSLVLEPYATVLPALSPSEGDAVAAVRDPRGTTVEGPGWSATLPTETAVDLVTDGEAVIAGSATGARAFGEDGVLRWTYDAQRTIALEGQARVGDLVPVRLALLDDGDEARLLLSPPAGVSGATLDARSGVAVPSVLSRGLAPRDMVATDTTVAYVVGSRATVVTDDDRESLRLGHLGGLGHHLALSPATEDGPPLVASAGVAGARLFTGDDGRERWSRDDLEACGEPTVVSATDDRPMRVLVPTTDGAVHALSPERGDERWVDTPRSAPDGRPTATPTRFTNAGAPPSSQLGAVPTAVRAARCPVVLADGAAVHVVRGDEVRTVDVALGRELAARDLPATPTTVPVLAGDRLLHADAQDVLHGVDLSAEGAGDDWRLALPSPAVGRPVVLDDGTIVVPTVDGLAALR